MTTNLPAPQLGDAITEARLESVRATLLLGMTRYPIASRTLLRSIVQVAPYLKETINRCLQEPDELAEGRPYLSIVPNYRGMSGAARFYLTRYEKIIDVLTEPRLSQHLQQLSDGDRTMERLRLLEALDRFPILNPSLMQAALGPLPAKYFRPDLEFFIARGIITVWHPDLLEASLAEATERIIHADVTHRGVRYFLTEHSALLRPFLVR